MSGCEDAGGVAAGPGHRPHGPGQEHHQYQGNHSHIQGHEFSGTLN